MAVLRKLILFLLLLVFLGGVYRLLNEEPPRAGRASALAAAKAWPPGIDQLLPDQEFSCLAVLDASQGPALYAGGNNGLFKIDLETLAARPVLDAGQAFQSVRALQVINGQLWVGHEQGLSILAADQVVRRIGQIDGLLDARVLDLLSVDTRTVYAATYSGVAVIQDGQEIRWLSGEAALPGESIKVMSRDNQGGIWMGAYNARGGGVQVQLPDGSRQYFTVADGLVHNSITSITLLPDGRIAVGGGVYTEGGASLLRQTAGRWTIERNLRREDGLAGDKVRHIFADQSGRIWYCSEYDGIAIFVADSWVRTLTEKDGLSDNEVKKILQLADGDYWLATRRGLTRISSEFLLVSENEMRPVAIRGWQDGPQFC